MRSALVVVVAITVYTSHCVSYDVGNTDDWVTVNRTDIYQALDLCAQQCVQFVNNKIWDTRQNRTCQSWGCVCSNSTQGENFLNGLSNITACVAQSCGSQSSKVSDAIEIYKDLCLVYTLNSTRPQAISDGTSLRIESPGYDEITDCAKFVLNGCLEDNGARTEPACGPLVEAPGWKQYRGVADQRHCPDSACICSDETFDVSIGTAYDAGMKFCAMRPSTQALPNPRLDDMLNVVATYCASYGFLHRNFTYEYSGVPPDMAHDGKMSVDSRIQIGLAGAALAITIVSLYVTYRMFKLAKEA